MDITFKHMTRKFPLHLALLFFLFAASQSLQAQCSAAFSSSPVAGTSTVNFTNTSMGTGPGTFSFWTFGDGGSAYTMGLSPTSHTYASPGTYMVCLNLSDSLGSCSSSACDTVLVTSGGGPTCNADFSSSVSGCTVTFTNLSTASGTIFGYSWNFGDGGTSSLTSPSHTYSGPGPWTVTLSFFTSDSCYDIHTATVSTPSCGGGGGGCDASFTYTVSGCDVTFTNTSSSTGAIMGYSWSFGDGGTSTLASPTHTYSGPGPWTVAMSFFAIDSCFDAFTATVSTPACGATAVEGAVQDGSLGVFPNPFRDEINLSFTLRKHSEVTVSLLDIAGRMVSSKVGGLLPAGSNTLKLDTPDVAPGIYLIRVKAGDETHLQKVIAL